jgi:diguanylate cyclase (GGDEF)-like protein
VLVELGKRLRTTVRPADTVARLGGDEFVVVCEDVDEAAALALGSRLEEAMRQPLTVAGAVHQLTASIGVALGRTDPDTLLGDADAAVYQAKAAGRSRVELFDGRRRR